MKPGLVKGSKNSVAFSERFLSNVLLCKKPRLVEKSVKAYASFQIFKLLRFELNIIQKY